MASISDPQVREFLQHGTRTGKLAYTAADGQPLVAPIWFVLNGNELIFNTGKDSAKGRAIGRDPRIALGVDLEQVPYSFVQVQGQAVTSEDPDELLRTGTAIAERYVPAERADEFGQRNALPGELVVRLLPTKIIAEFDIIG